MNITYMVTALYHFAIISSFVLYSKDGMDTVERAKVGQ